MQLLFNIHISALAHQRKKEIIEKEIYDFAITKKC
jgi:hypothetical protein